MDIDVAGRFVGGGLGLLAVGRFIRWLVEFIFKRFDLRAARLDAREKAIEEKFNSRLRHVENELVRTRSAMMILLNDTARRDPSNPVLQRVAAMLGPLDGSISGPLTDLAEPDLELDQLARDAEAALKGEGHA